MHTFHPISIALKFKAEIYSNWPKEAKLRFSFLGLQTEQAVQKLWIRTDSDGCVSPVDFGARYEATSTDRCNFRNSELLSLKQLKEHWTLLNVIQWVNNQMNEQVNEPNTQLKQRTLIGFKIRLLIGRLSSVDRYAFSGGSRRWLWMLAFSVWYPRLPNRQSLQ